MSVRNLAIEKNAVDTFAKQKGAQPANPQDWAQVYRLAYPNGDLPQELKSTTAASLYGTLAQQATTPPAPAVNVPTPTYGSSPDATLNALGQRANTAQAGVEQTSSPSASLKVLQDAIKTKIDTQNANIGESEIFSAAGLKGMPVLNQSLAQTGKELQDTRAQFTNTIQDMTGQYKDMANLAMFKYNAAVDAYDKRAAELQQSARDAQQHKDALDTLAVQNDLQKKLIAYQNANPDFKTQVDALQSGYSVGANGQPMDVNAGKILGFDISKYATDPNHEAAIASIVQGIGQFKDINEVSNYITSKYPNSPVTADMISKTSAKYGVPWEMLVAMMEQDSSLGTAGKAVRTKNPGNVGNTDSGATQNFGSWAAGVDAVGSWLNRHRTTQTSSTSTSAANALGSILPQLPAQQAKAAQAEFDRLGKSGDTGAQKEFIEQQAINVMPAAERSKAIGRQVAIDQLDNIQQQLNAFKTKGGNTNIFTGTAEEIANKAGATTDPDLRKIAVNIATAMIAYRSSVSGAAFTESEQRQYDKLFPSTGAVSDMNTATIAQLRDTFALNQGSAIKSVIGPTAYNNLQGTGSAVKNETPMSKQVTVTDPQGGKHVFNSQKEADNFKRLAEDQAKASIVWQ